MAHVLVVDSACARAENGAGARHSPAPVIATGAGECPATYAPDAAVSQSTRRAGEFVPPGADTAVLCIYAFGTQRPDDSYVLSSTKTAEGATIAKLTEALNALKPATESNSMCNLMGHDQYQILLRYHGAGHVLLQLRYNCGTVELPGDVRRVTSITPLLSAWPGVI